ncbi:MULTISPECIES: MOSC domain-containing protein [unclassified Pseudoclavibacter]|uniref:MOSC domain-containing protein n=1 Tax=unclassified Pseudoclavibacter TaxID=2615177 RepID=UPI000CE8BE9D|nr:MULTISPECIES: MOSC domain-containing protein [unclassified Pseudoclavibacter]MBF4548887.1 MOSC domain-containing protein [Pseudoclavibacter sp. VKM Ac-2888]PPF40320.1 MOSC domain-containing protein [Pseudoclavibacter sp. AY1H1]
MAQLLAVCAVAQLRRDPGAVGVTAIDKRTLEGPVKVGRYGVYGDVQADRKHHGGLDQAVYAYSQVDADHWAEELGRQLPPGFFGENLRIDGLDVNDLHIGDTLRIGDLTAAGSSRVVELVVTAPRVPCQTFARWVGGDDERGWVKRFSAAARVGAYLRVAKNGKIAAGDTVEVLETADEGAPTVRQVFSGDHGG